MQDLSALDLDEQALVKKQRPWGWFAFGLLGIVLVGFLLGYYVPLSSAHQALADEHEKLAKKASELDHALVETQKKLGAIDQERGELKKSADDEKSKASTLASRIEIAGGTVKKQLEKLVAAKLLTVTVAPDAVRIAIADKKLFLPSTSKVSPGIGKSLCSATESFAQKGDLALVVRVPALEPGEKGWALAGEKAASLAALLEVQCKVPGQLLVAEAEGPREGAEVRLEMKAR